MEIKLASGEYIHKIEGKTNGVLVDQFSVITYRPEEHGVTKYGPFGTGGNSLMRDMLLGSMDGQGRC